MEASLIAPCGKAEGRVSYEAVLHGTLKPDGSHWEAAY